MATRKAAKKPAKTATTAKPAKPARPGKAAKGAKRPAKRAKRKAAPLEFEEVQVQEPVKPGFFARMRAASEARATRHREEQARRDQERADAEERAQREAAAEERRQAAEAEREQRRIAEEEAAHILAEEKQRRAAEERRKVEERQAAALVRKEQRKAKRAALEERERLAAEQAEAEDRRKLEERAAKRAAREAAKRAEPVELEPELEFEEGSRRVAQQHALVPSGKPASEVDEQAAKVAAELARRRSRPVVIVEDERPAPRFPKAKTDESDDSDGTAGAGGTAAAPVGVTEAEATATGTPAPSGLSIPEAFLLLANEGGWDERAEKVKPGAFGGALAGALLLELLQHGHIVVQRDRYTVTGGPAGDEALAAVVARLHRTRERKGDLASLAQVRELARWNRELLEPFKDRLAGRGLAEHGHRMHLGLFYRSFVDVLDEDAQERLRNKLRRAIAGGGTPEASSILLLGLLDACGLLQTIVPDEAMDYNRKRLNGLLSGRDIMGYKVDARLKAVQEMAVRTILQNVRTLTGLH